MQEDQKIDHQLLSARFPGVVFQDSVMDLGVTLDGELTSDHVNACWKHLSLGVLPSSSAATHPSVSDRRNGCHTGSRVRSDQDRLLQRCPGRNHEATTEPASDGSQHCSPSTPANTEVRTHIVGDHRHLTLVACARSPHLQDMLSRLEQCCGCWSVIPTWTLHLVVGRLGTSTAFFNRFAPEGALLPLCHNTATGQHPGTQFLCSFACCLTTEDMLQLSRNNWNFFFFHGIFSTNRNSQLNWIQMRCWDYSM